MHWLLDTNILVRLNNPGDPRRAVARQAIAALRARADTLCYTSQNLAEFWNVCTRPTTARGGLGMSVAQTERRVRMIERHLTLLPDDPRVHEEWRRLLVLHQVIGLQVYDTRLVAAMQVYSVSHLLTFNIADFARYSGITPVHPQQV